MALNRIGESNWSKSRSEDVIEGEETWRHLFFSIGDEDPALLPCTTPPPPGRGNSSEAVTQLRWCLLPNTGVLLLLLLQFESALGEIGDPLDPFNNSLAWVFFSWRIRWSLRPNRWLQKEHWNSRLPVWTTSWRFKSLLVGKRLKHCPHWNLFSPGCRLPLSDPIPPPPPTPPPRVCCISLETAAAELNIGEDRSLEVAAVVTITSCWCRGLRCFDVDLNSEFKGGEGVFVVAVVVLQLPAVVQLEFVTVTPAAAGLISSWCWFLRCRVRSALLG